jgi:peptide subunit release factor 1 (eRF1)
LIKLKNRIKHHLEALEEREKSKAAREAVARDLDRIRDYLERPEHLPPGQGIAIFACEPLDLFEAIPLPLVFRSRLAIDRTPLVGELAALDNEFGLQLCAVYDRTAARFFRVTTSGISELPGFSAEEPMRPGKFRGKSTATPRGPAFAAMGEHNYHQRIREEKQRHYARIAERLFELNRLESPRGIVLAGMGAEAGAVESHLHPYVAKLVLGSTKLNPKTATPASVLAAVLDVRRESERAWEAEHARELTEGLGSGWAVNGFTATLSALARGQVRTLLVDPTVQKSGYRCAGDGRLVLRSEECVDRGAAEAVPDLADEAIEEALRQGGHVDVVEDPAVRRAVAGLAALLRFPIR